MSNIYNELPPLLDFHSQLRAFHFAISSGQLSLDRSVEVEKVVVDDASRLINLGVRAYQGITGEADKAEALTVLTQRTGASWKQMQMTETIEDALRMAIVNAATTIESVYDDKLDDAAESVFAHTVQAVDAACEDLARGLGFGYYGLDYLLSETPDVDGPAL